LCKRKLVPFLPSNPLVQVGGEKAITAISGAPYGSALVCLILTDTFVC
jgi:glycine dehydrogenase